MFRFGYVCPFPACCLNLWALLFRAAMCFCLRSGVGSDFAFCLVVLVCLCW